MWFLFDGVVLICVSWWFEGLVFQGLCNVVRESVVVYEFDTGFDTGFDIGALVHELLGEVRTENLVLWVQREFIELIVCSLISVNPVCVCKRVKFGSVHY